MSIFVDNFEREHPEEGTFVFAEPSHRDALKIPKIFGKQLSELQENVGDDDEGTIDIEANVDDIDFGELYNLLADLIVEWPEDDAEITPENVSKMKIDVLTWCMEQAFDVIQESQVTEDEEKN